MLIRLLLFIALLIAAARFFGRLIGALFGRPAAHRVNKAKKRPDDLDPSKIQDADFKDL